jgi:hypothetical protein
VIAWWLACADPAPVVSGGCAPSPDHPLRATCSFAAEPPGPISVTVTAEEDGAEAVVTGDGAERAVRRLRPETTYRFTAVAGDAAETGTFRTGPLPEDLALAVETVGEAPVDDVMFVVDCGMPTAVVLDPTGAVVWYRALAEGSDADPHHVVGLTFTPDRTVLAVVDNRFVREFDLDGALLREHAPAATPAIADQLVHHDAFRRNGVTYALRARLEAVGAETWLVDGVLAWDDAGDLLFDWDLTALGPTPSGEGAFGGVYWADRLPAALDWAHANGIHVDERGDFVISLHEHSTVMAIAGDPGAPDFGTPRWVLAGEAGDGPWPSDFGVVDPDGRTDDLVFGHQHHPSLLADGSLLLFDNGEDLADEARLLQLALDPAAGEASVRGSWPLGQVCPIEGGAFETSDGALLGTCGLRTSYSVLDRATGEVRGRTTARCERPAGLPLIPRAIPVDLR